MLLPQLGVAQTVFKANQVVNNPTVTGVVLSNGIATSTLSASSSPTLSSIQTTSTSTFAGVVIGSFNGFLKAVSGNVVTSLINLATDVSGVLDPSHGGTGTTSPPVANRLLLSNASGGYNLVSTSSLGISGGGGLSGSGTSTQVAFFGATTSLSSDSNLYWDNNFKFLGVQTASPLAPLDVSSISGITVPAPASVTAVLTLDPGINSPTTASATQITGPDQPTSFTTNISEFIDAVNNVGITANQNDSESGYFANGQSINYTLYAYRNVSGTYIVNPNGLSFGFNDNNDSSNYGVDITGWNTTNGYQDGYILVIDSAQLGHQVIDIGNVSSYADQGATGSVSYDTDAYASTGGSYNQYLYQYKLLNGSQYATSPVVNTTYDGGISGAYVIYGSTWGTATSDGFYYETNGGAFYDTGTGTAFTDWGQTTGSTGAPASFSSIAFPYFDQSGVSDGSLLDGPTQNDGSGSYFADGTVSLVYKILEYKINPVDSKEYVTSGYTYGFNDNSDFQNFNVSADVNPGTGSGRIWLVSRDGGSTYPCGQDIGGGTSFDDDGSCPTAPNVSNTLGSYSGTLRNYSNYGFITNPSIKYSSSPKTYSFTDNNPTEGYIIEHNQSTFGNATDMKVLETASYRGPGYIYDNSNVTTFDEFNSGLGDAVITPSTLGFLANGSNLNKTYHVYTKGLVFSNTVFSSTFATVSTVDPNDGNFYTVNLTIAPVAGSTFRINKVSTGWSDSSGTSFQDNVTVPWSGSSTITPTSYVGSAAIFNKFISSVTDAPIIQISSTNPGTVANSGIQFNYGTSTDTGNIAIGGGGHMILAAVSNGFDFTTGISNNPFDVLRSGTDTGGNVFNAQGSGAIDTTFNGGSGVVVNEMSSQSNTAFFGKNYQSFPLGDPTSAVAISANGSDYALNINGGSNSGADTVTAILKDTSGGQWWSLSRLGKMSISNTQNAFSQLANLYIGSGVSAYSQIVLAPTSLPSPVAGGIDRDDSNHTLDYTDDTATRKRVVLQLGTFGAGDVWRSDSNGMPVESNALNINTGLGLIIHNIADEFKQNATFDSGRNLTLNNGGNLILSGASTNYAYVAKTANYTLGVTDYAVNVTANAPTLTLPSAATAVQGRYYIIKNSATSTVTVTATSTQKIDGVTSVSLAPNDYLQIESTQSNWIVTARGIAADIYGTAHTWSAPQIFSATTTISGPLVDASSTPGTLGQILESVGNGVKWISQSALNVLGLITSYNGETTAGNGLMAIVANNDLTAQSGATTITTATSTNDGIPHTYRIGGYINVTAVTLDVAQVQVTYTDENNTGATATFFPQGLTSANIASTGNFPLPSQDIRVKANTLMTVKTILTTGTGSITYDVGGNIEKIK